MLYVWQWFEYASEALVNIYSIMHNFKVLETTGFLNTCLLLLASIMLNYVKDKSKSNFIVGQLYLVALRNLNYLVFDTSNAFPR